MKALDNFYAKQETTNKEFLLALRSIILSQDKLVTEELKYGMPFFCYKGKMFCYLWIHKKFGQPYLGLVEGIHLDHPNLIKENRSRMKIMLFSPEEDVPLQTVEILLQQALDLYRTGVVKIK